MKTSFVITVIVSLAIAGAMTACFYPKKTITSPRDFKTGYVIKYKGGDQDTVTNFYKCCNTTRLYNQGDYKYVSTKDIDTILELK